MKAAIVQYSPEWENPLSSIKKIEKLLRNYNSRPDMIIFPEQTLTGFTMNTEKFAEDIDGISTRFFMDVSSELNTNVFAGIIERTEEGFYNSLVHFYKGLIAARYRKIHPFSFGKEDVYYRASKEIVVTQIGNTKIGLTICYDLRFPELYRLYAKEGVEIIINIANWPIPRIEHWKTLLKARAIENQCFVLGANRVGEDTQHKYNGCSAVFDPMGNEIVMCEDEEKIIECEFDLSLVEETRNKFPFLKDMKLI